MSRLKTFKLQIKKSFILAFSIVLMFNALLLLTLPGMSNNTSSSNSNIDIRTHTILKKFSSYEELKDFLNRSMSSPWLLVDVERFTTITTTGITAKSTVTHIDYSKTNVQVEGVDEDDVVKTDGEYIYLTLGRRVLIIKAYPPNEAKLSAEIPVEGVVSGLFVNNKRLVIIYNSIYCRVENTGNTFEKREMLSIEPSLSVLIYDVKNAEAPILVRNTTISGMHFNSRMIGDYVYVLAYLPIRLRGEEPVLPEIIDGKYSIRVDPTSIYYSNASVFYNVFTVIFAINVKDSSEPITYETFLFGYASCIYVSLNNIYVAVPSYSESGVTTETHKIHIEGGKIEYELSGSVPGLVLNQFSMDEYDGYSRIATMTNQQVFRGLFSTITLREVENPIMSNVYVLNMSLVVGGIEGLAPGERIYSARFIGDRCYLVTFKKVDPLFVIDLGDPVNPKVLGKLKIPGYSDYLHPYDENHLIGIGKWTVEAEEGDFAWYQGVKISLFDVSDVEHPREIDSIIIIGDRGTDSPVLHNHKALLFDKELNLLAIPILLAEIDESKYPIGVPPNTYGDYVWQGLYVFKISENDISLRGRITHIESSDDFLKSGYWFYSDYAIDRQHPIHDLK